MASPAAIGYQAAANDTMTLEDAIEGARAACSKACGIRIRSDVPLAFCLSGGVDSSALVSIAAKALGMQLRNLLDHRRRRTLQRSRQHPGDGARCRLRPPVVEVFRRQDVIARLRDLVGYHDAPIATITFYVHSLISEAVHRAGYRVAFSGTSADELFTGYYDHFLLHLHAMAGEIRTTRGYLRELAKAHRLVFVRNPVLRDPTAVHEESRVSRARVRRRDEIAGVPGRIPPTAPSLKSNSCRRCCAIGC